MFQLKLYLLVCINIYCIYVCWKQLMFLSFSYNETTSKKPSAILIMYSEWLVVCNLQSIHCTGVGIIRNTRYSLRLCDTYISRNIIGHCEIIHIAVLYSFTCLNAQLDVNLPRNNLIPARGKVWIYWHFKQALLSHSLVW